MKYIPMEYACKFWAVRLEVLSELGMGSPVPPSPHHRLKFSSFSLNPIMLRICCYYRSSSPVKICLKLMMMMLLLLDKDWLDHHVPRREQGGGRRMNLLTNSINEFSTNCLGVQCTWWSVQLILTNPHLCSNGHRLASSIGQMWSEFNAKIG